MKNIKIVSISIVIMLILLAPSFHAYALKRAIFPDGQSLQPIPLPPGGHANISGNINSTVDSLPQNINQPANEPAPKNNLNEQTSESTNSNQTPYILWSIVILIIIVVIFTVYYKKRKHP